MSDALPVKLSRPKISGVFPRERLFKILDAEQGRSVIWVSGPAGSGKTTLAASYLAARKRPCLWYQVDEGDADIATFFYYMGMAAQKAAPRKKQPLPLLTPEYLGGIPVFTKRFFENLCGRLKAPFTIVFDNCQHVPEHALFHEVLALGLDALPEGINVMLLSRNDPAQHFARLHANNRMAVLGWNEVRFSLDESRQLARERALEDLSEGSLSELYKDTEGWAAGLVLLLESMKSGGPEYQALGHRAHKEIFNYFASEIFGKSSPELQEFLLKTAFLPRMTSSMAEKLTGLASARKILDDLSRNHFFTERHHNDHSSYQYHPLFREFLLSRTEETFAPEKVALIQDRAAGLLEESDQIEDAAALYLKTGNGESILRLILAHAQRLLTQGRSATIEEWLAGIPDEAVEKTPWALYWKGACRTPVNPSEGRRYFEKAFALFGTEGDPAGEFLSWASIVDSFLYEWSDFAPLDYWITVIGELMARHGGFPSIEIEARVTGSMLIALIFRQPQHPECSLWEDRVNALLRAMPDGRARIMMGSSLVSFYLWTGELTRMKVLIDVLRPDPGSGDVDPLRLLWWRFQEASYLLLNGDFMNCRTAVTESLAIAETRGVHLFDFALLALGVPSALSSGDPASGAELLGRMKAVMNPARLLDVAQYHCLAGWEAACRDEVRHALAHARESVAIADEAGSPFPQALTNLHLAQFLITLGEYPAAAPHIACVRSIGQDTKSTFISFVALLTEARLALEQGDEEQCLGLLRQAFAVGKTKGIMTFPSICPAIAGELCAKALEAGIEVDYVRDIIRRCALYDHPPSTEIGQWPWPLKIYTLGRFGLVREDMPVGFSGKVQQKSLALLKALIALGGREVREEQLADLLWPDAEGDAAHSAFTTALSRLRQLLGIEKAIRFQDGRATLDSRYCWVDAWAFERASGQADAIWKEEQRNGKGGVGIEEGMRLAERAIAMYKGHFLQADAGHPWTASLRERLRDKYLRLIARTGGHFEQTGAWQKAIEYYTRGTHVDDLAEEFYQRLIVCHRQLGQHAAAMAVYDRCRSVLSAHLGIAPSPTTEALYKSLLKDR
ncbi:MAG: BTAD domain-containing putative transcriptional regulator [Nitrospirota bacterium]